jgi:hypothetical protein
MFTAKLGDKIPKTKLDGHTPPPTTKIYQIITVCIRGTRRKQRCLKAGELHKRQPVLCRKHRGLARKHLGGAAQSINTKV